MSCTKINIPNSKVKSLFNRSKNKFQKMFFQMNEKRQKNKTNLERKIYWKNLPSDSIVILSNGVEPFKFVRKIQFGTRPSCPVEVIRTTQYSGLLATSTISTFCPCKTVKQLKPDDDKTEFGDQSSLIQALSPIVAVCF